MLTVRVLTALLTLAACLTAAGSEVPWAPAAWRAVWSLEDPARTVVDPGDPRHGVADEGLAVATPEGDVAVHDLRTGRRRYVIAAEAVPTESVWMTARTVVVLRERFRAAERHLTAYELADGTPLWRATVTIRPSGSEGSELDYLGPVVMVTEAGVTYLDRQVGPLTLTSLDLRTGKVIARASRPPGCDYRSGISSRAFALLTHCGGRVELASVDPRTLRPTWTRTLPPPRADPPPTLTASDDGYLHVSGDEARFFAPDGRQLSTAREALRHPADETPRTERWSQPLHVGAYPQLSEERLVSTSAKWPDLLFLTSLDAATGRIRALPITAPAGEAAGLVGTTDTMAVVLDATSRITAYTLVRAPVRGPGPPGTVPLPDWPDACALLDDRAFAALGGGYGPGPVRRTVAGSQAPNPTDCDWIPPEDDGAVVSVSISWVFATPAAAREAYTAMADGVRRTGSYDPVTETPHALTETLPPAPGGHMNQSLVVAGPALVHLRSPSRNALRLLTPPLQQSLLSRYEPSVTAPTEPAARPPGWSFAADVAIDRRLVVAGGHAYTSSDDGTLYALDAATGALRWSVPTGSSVTSGPISSGDTVYFALGSGLLALDAASGRTRWHRKITGATELVIDRGTLYADSDRYAVYALDPATGRTRWRDPADGVVRRILPHPAGDLVYAAGDDGVVALDARTGTRRWRVPVARFASVSSAATTSDTVYAATDDQIQAIDRLTGRVSWRRSEPVQVGIQVADGAVYVAGGSALSKLDAATGRRQWSYDVGPLRLTMNALKLARGVAYFNVALGRLHALDTATGRLRWSYPPQDEPDRRGHVWYLPATRLDAFAPVPHGDTLLTAFGDGTLHALDPATGTPRWTFEAGGEVTTPPVVKDGRIHVGGVNGNVYGIRAADGRVN
ncbi:PQQ-binding-like beta-propeller repeat protein [Nonomuraea longicatena]|uniref:Pyrrolo-quinoline quinone repeat domain-containing protein n=1 Tax=Nonomuraea longicatena TaxID=83682 RepID=A0ABN1NU29_9ACTN